MRLLIRSNRGRIWECDHVTTRFDDRAMVLHYEAVIYAGLPKGIYNYVGIKYPDGHEQWIPLEYRTLRLDWRGASPVRIYGEVTIS